jgi:hypothetical protein
MANKNITSIKVYSDPQHEAAMRSDIEKAKNALTKVVEIWDSLDIGPIPDLLTLVSDPEAGYSGAVNRNIEVPAQPGKFQLSRELYIKSLSIPVPNQLYLSCRECKRLKLCMKTGLWQIIDGKVEVVEMEAEMLIDSQSIYASTPEQKKFIEDVNMFVNALNAIGEKTELLIGRPCEFQFFMNKAFRVAQKSLPGPYIIELDPSLLRGVLSVI